MSYFVAQSCSLIILLNHLLTSSLISFLAGNQPPAAGQPPPQNVVAQKRFIRLMHTRTLHTRAQPAGNHAARGHTRAKPSSRPPADRVEHYFSRSQLASISSPAGQPAVIALALFLTF